jgi:predicted GTPase
MLEEKQTQRGTDTPEQTDREKHSWLKNLQQRLRQLLPVDKVSETIGSWFSVSETEIAEILTKVRAELPTTEAFLIGKPQTGKSSIIRGLTGVSAEIVGQGFRPHTQNTQRYNYPCDDLPLLVFTDTVGLGDIQNSTENIIQELTTELEQPNKGAKVLILTVKINDFATDSLREIAKQLRKKYAHIPCILAVTCLHELYPPEITEHSANPLVDENIKRAFTGITQDFANLYDRAVLIDFTLETDGYTPIFYGLEDFRDNLAELLPEAESQAIHQLLDNNTSNQIGNLYRDVARRYILTFSLIAATVAAVPLPFATMPVLTTLQVSMVGLIGKIYGQIISPSQAGGIISAIAGGFFAQAIGRELIKFIPGLGSVVAATWAAAYTWGFG